MSSMASDYGPSRARLVSHMLVDQHNVGSVVSPRTLGRQNLYTIAHSHVLGTSFYPLLDHQKRFGPLLEHLLNLHQSGTLWFLKTVVIMMRRVYVALPIVPGCILISCGLP